uniref:Homeobox domain-containing protein n=1 Tax=Musca domestica TaxID=7370 RepID=A0A1I8NKY9_MUSDO
MLKWLQEPEMQRMPSLRLAAAQEQRACTFVNSEQEFTRISEDFTASSVNLKTNVNAQDSNLHTKRSRLVFTDLQRRTLQAIFKETKRPSK